MGCERCLATKANGVRCKNRTCKQYPYCWIHLKSKDKLQVKSSTIQGAGKGLFYVGKQNFPKGKKIVDYSAKTITRSAHPTSAYDLQVSEGRYLNADDPSNYVGRYINDGRNPRINNVRFTKGTRIYEKNNRFVVPIYSTKVIKPNTELFMPYGRLYWDN